jgi:hypothetical protein
MDNPEGNFNRYGPYYNNGAGYNTPPSGYKPLPVKEKPKEISKEEVKKWEEETNPLLEKYDKKIVNNRVYNLLKIFAVIMTLAIVIFAILASRGNFKSVVSQNFTCPDVTCEKQTCNCPAVNIPSYNLSSYNVTCGKCPDLTCSNITCPPVNFTCNFPNNLNVSCVFENSSGNYLQIQ